MPDLTTPPADGQTGTLTITGTTPVIPGAGAPPEKPGKTFTQEELDAILEARLKRAIPADYEDLKKLAARVQADEEKNKTELEKAQAALAAAAEKEAAFNARLIAAEVKAEAAAQNAVDPDVVAALLVNSPDITVKDGEIAGTKQAVKALLKDKTYLVKQAGGSASSGEFGGTDQKTIQEQIKEAEAKGDLAGARRLKLASMVAR